MNNEMNLGLFERLSRLQWLLQRLQHRKRTENGPMADTTRGQGRILALLKLQDGIPTKDLSYLLGIRISSLNELLAKMERSGYIQREPSEPDRRVMLVKLTEKGRAEQQKDWNPEEIFSCLPEQDQISFAKNLDSVIASMEAEVGEEAGEDERSWWMGGGRERMGDEQFERFAAMRRNGFCRTESFDPRHGFRDFPHGRTGRSEQPGNPNHPRRPEYPDCPHHPEHPSSPEDLYGPEP